MEQPSIEVGDLVILECKEHTSQTTIGEAEFETVSPIQSLGEEGKSGIKVKNLTAGENSSCISCRAVGTLLGLELTEPRTTPTGSQRH